MGVGRWREMRSQRAGREKRAGWGGASRAGFWRRPGAGRPRASWSLPGVFVISLEQTRLFIYFSPLKYSDGDLYLFFALQKEVS